MSVNSDKRIQSIDSTKTVGNGTSKDGVSLKHFNGSKVFVEYSNDIDIFMKILNNTIQIRNTKILIVFNCMISDMFSNKNLQQRVKELFIRGRKLNISLTFITECYFEKSFKKFD